MILLKLIGSTPVILTATPGQSVASLIDEAHAAITSGFIIGDTSGGEGNTTLLAIMDNADFQTDSLNGVALGPADVVAIQAPPGLLKLEGTVDSDDYNCLTATPINRPNWSCGGFVAPQPGIRWQLFKLAYELAAKG